MPLYEYCCKQCGTFTAIRKMSESAHPADCGYCGSSSERVISIPHFALLGKAQRQAHDRNEKSAHEPQAIRRSSCGCTGAHSCKPSKGHGKLMADGAMKKQNDFQMQTKKTARPWMLGH